MALKEAIRDKFLRTTQIDLPDPQCVKEPVTFDKHYSPRPALDHGRADAKALICCVTDPGVCAGEAGTSGYVYVNQCNCFVSQWGGGGGQADQVASLKGCGTDWRGPAQRGSSHSPLEEVANQN